MQQSPLRVGIAGLGTVGTTVVQQILTNSTALSRRARRDISIAGVSARRRDLDRGINISDLPWFDDPSALAVAGEIDVFVELIGGAEGVARQCVEAAIAAGKPVVSANKALLAAHGNELAQAAQAANVPLNFEAAIAGGIPIVKILREALNANTISAVYGILNGTCNYILTRMEAEPDLGFAPCLEQAQSLGYAEADPSFDVDGHDAAHKLAIIASLAFGTRINGKTVYCEGIRDITQADIRAAQELGYRIKLLAVAQLTETGIEQRVHLAMIPADAALARVSGVTNAVAVTCDLLGELVTIGPGAGGKATASAVLADIIDIARDRRTPPLGFGYEDLVAHKPAPMGDHEGGYYIRINLMDKPGALAAIAKRMAEEEISLRNIIQRQRFAGDKILQLQARSDVQAESKPTPGNETTGDLQPVIMITHATNEAAVRRALNLVRDDGYTFGEPHMIRIEPLPTPGKD